MGEITTEDPVAVPLLAPAHGVPDVIDTPERFESALVELKNGTGPLPSMPKGHRVTNTVLVHISFKLSEPTVAFI
jgi:hypothetical protein